MSTIRHPAAILIRSYSDQDPAYPALAKGWFRDSGNFRILVMTLVPNYRVFIGLAIGMVFAF